MVKCQMIKLVIQFNKITKANLLKLHLRKLNNSQRIMTTLKMFNTSM